MQLRFHTGKIPIEQCRLYTDNKSSIQAKSRPRADLIVLVNYDKEI